MTDTKIYFTTVLLAIGTFLASCDKDDDGPGTLYPGSDQYGRQLDLSTRDRNLFTGTFYLESWTAEEPKDWNGDGTASTDLLTELDACYRDNGLTFIFDDYNRTDEGMLCHGDHAEGEVLIQGEWFFSYDATTKYAKITFYNEEGGRADGIQQMELFMEGQTRTLIGKIWDYEYKSLDVVVYRTR